MSIRERHGKILRAWLISTSRICFRRWSRGERRARLSKMQDMLNRCLREKACVDSTSLAGLKVEEMISEMLTGEARCAQLP